MTRHARIILLALIAVAALPIVASAVDTHYLFNRNTAAGFRLGRAHEDLGNAMARLADEFATMTAMINGDGSADAHYAAVTAAYGFANDADAHNAYLELNALQGKLTTDGSVSSVNAAIKQFLARLRS